MSLSRALAIDNLSSGYAQAIIVHDVSFEIAPGEIVAILGKNGMGKTTLLRTIMGFVNKQSGKVVCNGTDISAFAPHRIAALGVGYVAQEQALFQDLSVEENVRLAVRKRPIAEALAVVAESFPFLLDRLAQPAGTLSGGEQKMLLMARTLSTGAKTLLVDEITEGLQPTMVQRVGAVIRAAREKDGRSFLVVEQNLGFALAVADRYLVMQGGEIVLSGQCADAGAAEAITAYLRV